MRSFAYVFILATALFVSACSDNKPAENKTVIDHQIKSYEKARGVEQVLQQSDQARRKQMEEQSQ